MISISKQTQELYEALQLYADNIVKLGDMRTTRHSFPPVRVCYVYFNVGSAIWTRAGWKQCSIHRKIMNYIGRPNIPDRR